jgi:hypothetical protein
MNDKCPCGKKGKKYTLIACKDCKKNVESFGFELEEIK